MKCLHRVLLGSLIILSSITLLAGCTPKPEDEVPLHEEVAQVQEDSQIVKELQILQEKHNKLSADYDTAKSEVEEKQAQYDKLNQEHSELRTKYDELNTKYNELSAKYDVVMQGTAGIKEEDVEQAIFRLINQERRKNGLNLLEWTDSIYMWAKEHSDDMATKKRLEYSEYSYSQDVFRAAGYSTIDRIAEATLMIWEESLQYERNFLNEHTSYGAVAVTKSGEIFYITYFAHSQK